MTEVCYRIRIRSTKDGRCWWSMLCPLVKYIDYLGWIMEDASREIVYIVRIKAKQ